MVQTTTGGQQRYDNNPANTAGEITRTEYRPVDIAAAAVQQSGATGATPANTTVTEIRDRAADGKEAGHNGPREETGSGDAATFKHSTSLKESVHAAAMMGGTGVTESVPKPVPGGERHPEMPDRAINQAEPSHLHKNE